MKKRPPITQEQREEIIYLRGERGLSYRQIAQKMDLSLGTVQTTCLFESVEKKGRKPGCHRILNAETYTYIRNGRKVRGFTEQEDKIILEMEKKGCSYSKIGRELERHHNSIKCRLAILARREERKLETERN